MNENIENVIKNSGNIFILGAGASVDYGMPLWDELKKEMIDTIEFCLKYTDEYLPRVKISNIKPHELLHLKMVVQEHA